MIHLDEVVLERDEVETLRLLDLDGRYHQDAAQSLGVSRGTIGRLADSARRKIADAILNGKAIRLEGDS